MTDLIEIFFGKSNSKVINNIMKEKLENQIEIAKKMKNKNISIEQIAEFTELSIEEINKF